MAYEDYMNALQEGRYMFRRRTAKGHYPYLPVLDDILSRTVTEGEVYLGTMDIPLDQVIGTCTAGRTNAFASNFMPLLDYNSEFAMKWSKLHDAQISEGIHDAVKVYEYMGKYYVLEGNKRVSVLKYMDCPTIFADVTRKIPKKTHDIDVQIYYEYMDFYEITKVNFIQMSKLGSFPSLLSSLGVTSAEDWNDDKKIDFSSFYNNFTLAYNECGGNKLTITVGDALLFYISVYPYKKVKDKLQADIKKQLEKIWPEIVLLGESHSVEIVMDPSDEKKFVKNMFKKIISHAKKKVAFVYDREPKVSDWIYAHELGRLHLNEVMDYAIETESFVVENTDSKAEKLLRKLCKEKYDIIFTVTPQLIKSSIKIAASYPQVRILNCSPMASHNTVMTYYPRLYESKLLTGMIAGMTCENDKIGYIADYPINGMTANINAFAIGAKMANPYAKVYLEWSTAKDYNPSKLFEEENINYISTQDMIAPYNSGKDYGLYSIHEGVKSNIAMSICNWGVFYEKLVSNIIEGTLQTEHAAGEYKAMNYYWGLSSDAIDIIYSQNIFPENLKLVKMIKNAIKDGIFNPFSGPIHDQKGKLRVSKTDILPPEKIITMNWLVDNVIGRIPTLDELTDEAKPIVELRGIDKTLTDQSASTIL
ncbi:MAG: BMP family ABC transporter substrate-binding protein [Eubacterium sp.]|nr:BMP family ABC transporter substrate-binding protein [Eubacterium sp.]